MKKKKKNEGEIRYKIALERIYYVGLRGGGTSFLHWTMYEMVHYALTGKLTSPNPTHAPDQKDLNEIDYGIPKGVEFIKKERDNELKEMCDGWGKLQ
jgi:hypothetical protein